MSEFMDWFHTVYTTCKDSKDGVVSWHLAQKIMEEHNVKKHKVLSFIKRLQEPFLTQKDEFVYPILSRNIVNVNKRFHVALQLHEAWKSRGLNDAKNVFSNDIVPYLYI